MQAEQPEEGSQMERHGETEIQDDPGLGQDSLVREVGTELGLSQSCYKKWECE